MEKKLRKLFMPDYFYKKHNAQCCNLFASGVLSKSKDCWQVSMNSCASLAAVKPAKVEDRIKCVKSTPANFQTRTTVIYKIKK